MSTGIKRPYEQVQPIAQSVLDGLAPSCSWIQLAGSLRRQKAMIGDVEIVAAVTLGESGCGRGRVLGGATPKKWNYILSENKPELARLTYGKYSTYEALYKM